jgi:hypothetical protein
MDQELQKLEREAALLQSIELMLTAAGAACLALRECLRTQEEMLSALSSYLDKHGFTRD